MMDVPLTIPSILERAARFFADHVLTQAEGLAATVIDGAASALALPVDQY